eukprot:3516778-Pleurochrysis_carterae.AAC.1
MWEVARAARTVSERGRVATPSQESWVVRGMSCACSSYRPPLRRRPKEGRCPDASGDMRSSLRAPKEQSASPWEQSWLTERSVS